MKDSTRHESGGQRGFTLVETSIAMVVMMVVGLGAASLFAWAVTYNAAAAGRELAGILAQQRMERLRTIPFDSDTRNLAFTAGGLGATAANGVTETDVASGGRSFTVTTTIDDVAFDTAPTPAPTLKRITVRVVPEGVAPALGGVTLSTLRATAIKGTY